MPKTAIPIESREHLLSALAEASELEHNLMCLYLYAVFSLKQSVDEGLSQRELAMVQNWRKSILDVAIQEMGHLALVANLTVAVGGSAHFLRPAFPVAPGIFPDDFVVELAPFDMATVDHYIFLERPEGHDVQPSEAFEPDQNYLRSSTRDRLMAHFGNYGTVGELYFAIEKGISYLAKELGEDNLFCGSQNLQLTKKEIDLEGLDPIHNEKSAIRAIHLIVEQGEGARTEAGSHFEKFQTIKSQYQQILSKNPEFRPARPCAKNPVMRKPIKAGDLVWVNHPRSSLYLDLGNAIYGLMLRALTQIYSMEARPADSRQLLLESAFQLMHCVAKTASYLSKLPATEADGSTNAGLSFSLNRHLNPWELNCEKALFVERLDEILDGIHRIQAKEDHLNSQDSRIVLESVFSILKGIRDRLLSGPATSSIVR